MDTVREYVEKWRRDVKEAASSITGTPHKDYNQMILDLDRPSLKDQSTIFRMRSAFAFSTTLGSVVSTATAWWAVKYAGSSWYRLRFPLTAAAAWVGAIVGSKQGTQMGIEMLSSLEDPNLREIMSAYQHSHLSSKEEVSLKRNILDNIRVDEIRKYEQSQSDMTTRDKLDHLKHERERLRVPPSEPTPVSPTAPPDHATSTPRLRTNGPTPYLHRRLPEAVEAEKRRAEAQTTEEAPESKP